MGLPVQRIHTDRAKEFVGRGFQKWIRDHDFYHTMSSGSEPQGNARVEREVRELKQRMRTVLTASKAPISFWPLALRHVGEQRLRRQLQSLGVTTPELLPFGMKAMVKQKLWQKRDDTLKYPMQKVRLWGPAADMATTSLGYYVQSDETGKFFRSTVVKVFADRSALQDERGGAPRGEDEQGDDHPQIHDDDFDEDGHGPGDQRPLGDQDHLEIKPKDHQDKNNDLINNKMENNMDQFPVMDHKASSTTMRSHHKVHQEELMSQRKGYHFNQTWRSTRCWKKSMKDDQPWRLNNRRNPRDGGYMEKVLNTDHTTRGSSR